MSQDTLFDNDPIGDVQIEEEAARLHQRLVHVGWTLPECRRIAPKTLRIKQLAREKDAVILGHSYVTAEVLYGVADHMGDSLGLSVVARDTDAGTIIFCGVRFMAETAKILSPGKTVLMPVPLAGCSLSESISGEDVKKFRAENPDRCVVCYVNTSAETKAECDVCCTSANALAVVENVPRRNIAFVPDANMAANLKDLTSRDVIGYSGNCIVHQGVTVELVNKLKKQAGPGCCVMVHTESPKEIVDMADVAGGTSDMMKAVKSGKWQSFVVITEDGMTDRFKIEFPDKRFIALGAVCSHMKMIGLDQVLQVLESPRPDQVCEIEESVRQRAAKAINAMFEFTQAGLDASKPHSNAGDLS